jgi:hypothetical protein
MPRRSSVSRCVFGGLERGVAYGRTNGEVDFVLDSLFLPFFFLLFLLFLFCFSTVDLGLLRPPFGGHLDGRSGRFGWFGDLWLDDISSIALFLSLDLGLDLTRRPR